MILALDVSNWTGDLDALYAQYPETQLLVVRLSIETPAKRAKAVSQLQWGQRNGLALAGYVWCYWASEAMVLIDEATSVAEEAGVTLRFVALDAEDPDPERDPGAIIAWLLAAAEAVRHKGGRPILYSGKWWLDALSIDLSPLGSLGLWLAAYDGRESLEFGGYGPWKELLGKQYTATPTDLNLFRSEVLHWP